jgi:hypothetical protein
VEGVRAIGLRDPGRLTNSGDDALVFDTFGSPPVFRVAPASMDLSG